MIQISESKNFHSRGANKINLFLQISLWHQYILVAKALEINARGLNILFRIKL